MVEEMRFQNPEEEIKYLEQKILEKKRALETRETREIVSESLREHAEEYVPAESQSSPALPPDTDSSSGNDMSKDVSMLVQIAFRDGVITAVKRARETKNPYVIDALHDALVDKFMKDLTSRGLIPPH